MPFIGGNVAGESQVGGCARENAAKGEHGDSITRSLII